MTKIPMFKICWDEEDIKSTSETIEAGMHWAIGPNIDGFEKAISNYIGTKYCVVFNSGTSALHAALLAHGVKQGDEIVVPSFTFIATANAPLFVDAKPVFADIEEKTCGLDPECIKEAITKKTKAIIPVHYAGSPCLINELKEIAEDHNLILIEDAAESFGAKIKEKMVGTFGDSAMFSFCSNKIITTGEGGAVVTDSGELYEKLKLLRSHGRLETSDYFSSTGYMAYVAIGYNFRMSNITAALGLSQLKKVDKIIRMRRENAKYLTEKLAKIKEIIPPIVHEDYFHVYQMYTIRINGETSLRDKLIEHLTKMDIAAKVYFYPVHLTHFYREKFEYRGGELPVTEAISNQVLTLPMYPTLTNCEIDYIVEQINNFFTEEM